MQGTPLAPQQLRELLYKQSKQIRAKQQHSNRSSAVTSFNQTKKTMSKSTTVLNRNSYLYSDEPSQIRGTPSRCSTQPKRQFLQVVSSHRDLHICESKSNRLSNVRSYSLMIGPASSRNSARTTKNKLILSGQDKMNMRSSLPTPTVKHTDFLHPKQSLQINRMSAPGKQLQHSQSACLRPQTPRASSQLLQRPQTTQSPHNQVMRKLEQKEIGPRGSNTQNNKLVIQGPPVYRVISKKQIIRNPTTQPLRPVIELTRSTPKKEAQVKRQTIKYTPCQSIELTRNQEILTTSAFFQQMPSYSRATAIYQLSSEMLSIQNQRQQVEGRINEQLDNISQKASSIVNKSPPPKQQHLDIHKPIKHLNSVKVEKENTENELQRDPLTDRSQLSNASILTFKDSTHVRIKSGQIKSQSTVLYKNSENEPPISTSQLRQHILTRIFS